MICHRCGRRRTPMMLWCPCPVVTCTAVPAYVGHCYATPDASVVHEAEPRVTSTASAPLSNESRTR